MPRPRGAELPQQRQQPRRRQSPRGLPHLQTTSSDSNGVHPHHRSSPHSPLPESPVGNQRKSGSRVADLEAKLGHAQEELRRLREQLASAEAARRSAEQELQEPKKLIPADGEQEVEEAYHISIATQLDAQEKEDAPPAVASPAEEGKIQVDPVEISAPELVPAAAGPEEPFLEKEDDEIDVKTAKEDAEVSGDDVGKLVEEEEGKEEAASRAEKTEAAELEAKLAEKMEEHKRCWAENSTLRRQLTEAEAEAAAARAGEAETASKLSQAAEEVAQSKARAEWLGEQLQAAEGAKASLEAEMKRVRVQTEQWRKAADAAAAALSATEAGGRRVAERCPSMDKHLGAGSPLEEGLGGRRSKGAGGIRVLGDLWKKKAHHK